jgi:hypothetical protein
MCEKYVDITKTEDFDTICQLMGEMTETSFQPTESLQGENGDVIGTRGNLEEPRTSRF